MSANKRNSHTTWTDPDDAPELTDEFFERADAYAGEQLIKRGRGRPKAAETKELISLRLSREVIESFRATGAGWQTRIDEALRDWLATHSR